MFEASVYFQCAHVKIYTKISGLSKSKALADNTLMIACITEYEEL